MSLILILVFGLTTGRPVWAHDCAAMLGGASSTALRQQVRKLNSHLLLPDQDLSPSQLYLLLKGEERRYQGHMISEELARELQVSKAKHYHLAAMDPSALTRFYLNAIYALYLRAANEWRTAEVKRLTDVSSRSSATNMAGFLLDSFFSPSDLNDPQTTPEQAAASFQSRPWLNFPWHEALTAVTNFADRPFHEFVGWSQANTTLDWNDANRIAVALSSRDRLGECCRSDAACTLCPHNRQWLK